MRRASRYAAALLSIMMVAACGGSTTTDSSSSSSSSGGSSSSSGGSADSGITTTVPTDVVLSSPTASTAASQSRSAGKSVAKEDPAPAAKPGDPAGPDYAAKKEALQALVSGEGECAFTMEIPTITEPACYGPVINYSGHPDAASANPPQNATGGLPPSDVGIWNETEGTQACAAAMMNALVDKVASKVDNMIKIFGAMACAGKKAGLEPPAVGATVDLSSAMSSNVTVTGLAITTATVQRLEDDADGNPVYLSTIGITMTFENGDSKSGEIILKHIPTSADNSTYKGKIATKIQFDDVQGCGGSGQMNDPGAGVMAGSVLYAKSSASSVVYQFNFSDFCGENANPFDSNYNIDPADKYLPGQTTSGWVHNWNYGLFSLNPENGLGSVAYAWQAGAADGRTRTFNMSVTAAADGSASGSAYYGFGPDMAASSGVGTIDGFVCNWAGPNGAISSGTNSDSRSAASLLAAGRGVSKAQKQVMSRAASATEFTTTAENSAIAYAVRNSCEAAVGDGFLFDAEGSGSFSNDRASDAAALPSELIDLEDIDFTMPTAPSEV